MQGEQVTELPIATFDMVSKPPAFSEALLYFYAWLQRVKNYPVKQRKSSYDWAEVENG